MLVWTHDAAFAWVAARPGMSSFSMPRMRPMPEPRRASMTLLLGTCKAARRPAPTGGRCRPYRCTRQWTAHLHGKLCNKKHDFQQNLTNFISLKIPNHIPVRMVTKTPKTSAPASIGAKPCRNATSAAVAPETVNHAASPALLSDNSRLPSLQSLTCCDF
jgi:hypothetical protein